MGVDFYDNRAPAGNAKQGTGNKEKETECREHMNCRKIGLSGCQALDLVFHLKMTPYFGDVKADLFVRLLQSKDCTRAFVLHFHV